MNERTELKPCPFCGGEANVYEYEAEQAIYDKDTLGFLDIERCERYGCGCPDCGCIIADKTSKQKAIEAWNRRADNEQRNQIEAVVKFKHWLIKKLGGHVNQKVVNPKAFECRYVENTPITLVAERQVRLRFYHTAREENEHIERQIKEDLASEISRELLKNGLLVIEKGEDPINLVTRYRAKIMVYPMKGAYYEQRKAD